MPKRDPITLILAIVVSIAAVAIGINNLVTIVDTLQPTPSERNSSAPPSI